MLAERLRPTRTEAEWVLAERLDRDAQVAVWPLPAGVEDERLHAVDALRLAGVARLRAVGVAGDDDGAFGLGPGVRFALLDAADLADAAAWEDVSERLAPESRLAVAVQTTWTLKRVHAAGIVFGDAPPRSLRVDVGEQVRALWVAPGVVGPEHDAAEDLRALGARLAAGLPRASDHPSDRRLATLCARLQEPDPDRRPSADEALRRLLEWSPRASSALALPRDLPPVGREEELDALSALARARLSGDPAAPCWVLLEGEPGSGREALLEELGRRVRLAGHRAREGLDRELAGLVWVPDLAALDPDARGALLRGVQRIAVEDRPALVAIGLDRPTRAGLDLRTGALSPPAEVALEPLEPEAVARLVRALLGGEPPPALLGVVERWSGGLPERVQRSVERLRAEGVLVAGADGWRAQVERLPDLPAALPDDAAAFPPGSTRDERRLLRALAVSSGGAARGSLGQVVGLGASALDAAVTRLTAAGVLRADGGRVGFASERARLRGLESLAPREAARLRRAHRTWLEGLEEPQGPDLGALAEHALALGDATRAARWVPAAAAADDAAGRPARALERRLAWRPLFAALDPAARVDACAALGDSLLGAGRVAAAEEAYAQALATRSPAIAASQRASLHRRRAECALRRGDVSAARASIARAERSLGKAEGEEALAEAERLRGLRAQAALKAGDRSEVLEVTAGAFERPLDDRARASLLNLRGLAHFHRGEPEEARRCFAESLATCEALGLDVGRAVVLGNQALVEDYQGRPSEAEALHERSLEVAREAGAQSQVGAALSNLGNLANRAGRLEQARARYRESLALAAERGDDEAVCIGLCALADTFLRRGDPRSALPYLERAAALAGVIGVPYVEALAAVNAAEAHAALGRLEAARAAAAAAVELRRGLGEPARLARALTLAARIEASCGEPAEAASRAAEAATALGDDPHPIAQAEVALALGRHEAAAASFARGHERLGLARVGLARARAALEEGRLPEAGQAATRARAEAEACGAHALAAEAELLALEADQDRSARSLDRVRAARGLAHRFELPELARRAAGLLARLHDLRGEALEAGAARLDARRVVDAQCAGVPPALGRSLRARPDVARDLSPAAGTSGEGSPQEPARADPAPAPRLEDCLRAAATLLRASRCALVARGPTLLGAYGGEAGELTEAEREAAGGIAPATVLRVPVPGRDAWLAAQRTEPFGPADRLAAAGLVAALIDHVDRPRATGSLRPTHPEPYGLIGRSPALQEVVRQVERFAPFALPVLLQGESGTGKELVARALHAASPRRNGPFVAVNASAFPPELAVSELFGVEAGAFTGADRRRAGLFELAHGGTLFLDEVADAPAAVQAMLLRVLEEGEVRRVGGDVAISVDVRVVTASLRDLAAEVQAGRFREDLYYRLCGLELRLPPLRERAEDIGLLARRFLEQAAAEGRRAARLDPEALRRLERYPWPGNVRELRNALERALALGSGPLIHAADLGPPAEEAGPEACAGSLRSLEKEAIARALAEHPTLTAAARSLGIHRRTLRRRMERHGL